MSRPVFAFAFAVCSALLLASAIYVQAAPAPAKIHPRVWQDTENGGKARFLVLLREQTNTTHTAKGNRDARAERRSVVADLRATAQRAQTDLRQLLTRSGAKHRPYWIINMIAAEGSRGLVESLAGRDDVLAIESDRAFQAKLEGPQPDLQAPAPESLAAVEPNLVRIRAPNVWALGFTGQGIVYANADTGVEWTHPALKPHYRGWNGTSVDHNHNWWDAVHNDLNGNGTNPVGFDLRSPADDNGHGTHTMGIGIGSDGGINQIGVAPGAKFICCRNMDEGTGRPSTYIECMQFFLAPTDLDGNNPDPDRGADAVGNSYGCPPDELCAPNSLHLMLENLRAAGIFMAVSAGNSGPACSSIDTPPPLDSASVTVGATDNQDSLASFSSRGPVTIDGSNRLKPDLVAPGVNVRSSVPGGAYTFLSGTSMSSPHLAGGVALLWSAFPHIRGNIDYTLTILEQSAVHLTNSESCGTNTGVPNNLFGFGRIDLLSAYDSINRPPIASNSLATIPGDMVTPLSLTGSDPESAPLHFEIIQPPTNGLISQFNEASGSLNYTPAHAFAGRDAVIFRINDGLWSSSNAVFLLTVIAPPDTDGDGIPDLWETAHSLNPRDSNDAQTDSDHDGLTNFAEYVADTDPHASNSLFRITAAVRDSSNRTIVTWTSTGGTRYRVQFVDRQSAAQEWNFVDIPRPIELEMDGGALATPGTMTFVDDFSLTSPPAPGTSRYYRIRVVR